MSLMAETVWRDPAAAGSSRPHVLYLAHRLPYPPDKGDRIRTYHVLKSISGRASVHLACLADEPVDPSSVAALGDLCERVEVVPLGHLTRRVRTLLSLVRGSTATEGAFDSPALRAVLRRWTRQTRFHAALASASSMVPYLRMAGLRDVSAVVDLVDVDSQKWFDYAEVHNGPKRWLYRLEGRRLRRLERTLPDWARAVTLVSEAETELFRQSCTGGAVYGITNGVDLEAFRPQEACPERGCVFVGALDYRPNVQGVVWFCREVWPAVRQRSSQATLSLVGRRPVAEVRRLARLPGVVLVGQVADVRPYLAAAAVAVVPLQIARGIQNKVLEALAMGKAVVTSPEALCGLGAKPGVHLLSASSPNQWVEAISRLLDAPDLRERLGREGRRYVEVRHRWENCLELFASLLGLPKRTASHPG
jgi:sugar transferase (PEP-CTERM/EpsH1 system associated)